MHRCCLINFSIATWQIIWDACLTENNCKILTIVHSFIICYIKMYSKLHSINCFSWFLFMNRQISSQTLWTCKLHVHFLKTLLFPVLFIFPLSFYLPINFLYLFNFSGILLIDCLASTNRRKNNYLFLSSSQSELSALWLF